MSLPPIPPATQPLISIDSEGKVTQNFDGFWYGYLQRLWWALSGVSDEVDTLSTTVIALSTTVAGFSGTVPTMHKAAFTGNGVDLTVTDTIGAVSFVTTDFDVGGVFANPTMTIVQDGVYVLAATTNFFNFPETASLGLEIWNGSTSIAWSYRTAHGLGIDVMHVNKTISATVGQQFSFQAVAAVTGTILGASQSIYGSIIQVL